MAPDDEIRCKALAKNGKRCKAPSRLVDPEVGLCLSHDPERRQQLSDAAQRGGRSRARRLRNPGLEDEELPPLDCPHAAAAWLEIVGRAVATGRLSNRDADAVTRAVKEWLRAHEAGDVADQVNTLKAQLVEIKATLGKAKTMEVLK